MIRKPLADRLLEKHNLSTIAENIGRESGELIKEGVFDPFEVLDIDTILIASRHLYRMPYSLNEKSGLASVVITPEEILGFKKEDALPEKVVPTMQFLPRENVIRGEASKLVVQAFDFKAKIEPMIKIEKKEYEVPEEAVPDMFFPPCIKAISEGLQDGKKRAVFILINFLRSMGWSYEQVEEYIENWNEKNPEPLREVIWKGQLRHHKAMKKKVLPPNCANKAYMIDLGVCKPDGLCRANTEPGHENFAARIKNPANYARARQRMAAEHAEKQPKKEEKSSENTNSEEQTGKK
jgi:hypothetical protein